MTLPSPVSTSATQGATQYSNVILSSLVAPFTQEKTNAIVTVDTPTVTQDASTGVITVTAKITMQSYLNGGKSQVTISQPITSNTFKAPIPLLTIDQTVGLTIFNVSHNFAVGTQGDFILTISGDNVFKVINIGNPFD